jgi:cell division protein ZapA
MSDVFAHVTVRILEKEYQVACPVNERTDLLDAAEFLNGQMRGIRDSGKVVGLDRIAVMAALNMANELLQLRSREDAVKSTIGSRLQALTERADRVLEDSRQLKL